MEQILKYFPELTDEQRKQLEALDALYRDWNEKINVISFALLPVNTAYGSCALNFNGNKSVSKQRMLNSLFFIFSFSF